MLHAVRMACGVVVCALGVIMAIFQAYLAEFGPPTQPDAKAHIFVGAIIVGIIWVCGAVGFGISEFIRDRRRDMERTEQTKRLEMHLSEERDERKQIGMRYAELHALLGNAAPSGITRRALLHIRNVYELWEEWS